MFGAFVEEGIVRIVVGEVSKIEKERRKIIGESAFKILRKN